MEIPQLLIQNIGIFFSINVGARVPGFQNVDPDHFIGRPSQRKSLLKCLTWTIDFIAFFTGQLLNEFPAYDNSKRGIAASLLNSSLGSSRASFHFFNIFQKSSLSRSFLFMNFLPVRQKYRLCESMIFKYIIDLFHIDKLYLADGGQFLDIPVEPGKDTRRSLSIP